MVLTLGKAVMEGVSSREELLVFEEKEREGAAAAADGYILGFNLEYKY